MASVGGSNGVPAHSADIWGLIDRGVILRLVFRGALLTLAINAVGLVSPLFFTQVYDRVLSTGNGATLATLTLAALLAIAIGGALDQWRTVTFARVGARVYVDLEQKVFRASHTAALEASAGRRSRPLDDLELVRSTISGSLPGALLDVIFAPFLLTMLYLMNVWLGHFALATLVAMWIVTTLTQWSVGALSRKSTEITQTAMSLAESHLRAAEAAHAMGYADRAAARWAALNRQAVKTQIAAAARAGGLIAAGRAIRSGAQILVIAEAALLVVAGDITGGSIMAASIILGRLLAPVDQLLSGWRQIAQARLAAERLRALLKAPAQTPAIAILQKPAGRLLADNIVASSADGRPILRGISFALEPGESIAIVGPSGSGKSTLLRCLMGVWPRMSGLVRLDGAPISQIDRNRISGWLGFLPQTSDLAPGTIGENIARFGPAQPGEIEAALGAAGADALVAAMPRGLDTEVGEIGARLSAGERRRIALARALFGSPSLVCLDEPEANLDREGEIALAKALASLKAAGATVVVTAHRPSVIAFVDKVLVLKDGRIAQAGPAAEVLSIVAPGVRRATP